MPLPKSGYGMFGGKELARKVAEADEAVKEWGRIGEEVIQRKVAASSAASNRLAAEGWAFVVDGDSKANEVETKGELVEDPSTDSSDGVRFQAGMECLGDDLEAPARAAAGATVSGKMATADGTAAGGNQPSDNLNSQQHSASLQSQLQGGPPTSHQSTGGNPYFNLTNHNQAGRNAGWQLQPAMSQMRLQMAAAHAAGHYQQQPHGGCNDLAFLRAYYRPQSAAATVGFPQNEQQLKRYAGGPANSNLLGFPPGGFPTPPMLAANPFFAAGRQGPSISSRTSDVINSLMMGPRATRSSSSQGPLLPTPSMQNMVAGTNRFYPNYNSGNPATGGSNRGPYPFPLLRGPPNRYPSGASRENNGENGSSIGRGWPYVTARGTIALRLNGNIMIEMTSDQAIRIVNYQNNILLTIDASGLCSAMVHPNGRMHQHNSRVEIVVYEPDGNHKYAKMWYKGVSFTSERCSLVYLVDEGGTRTTADRFSPQLHAPAFATSSVFLNGSSHSTEAAFVDCYTILQDTYDYYRTKNGTDVWIINSVRISQTDDLMVSISRDSRDNGRAVKRKLKTTSGLGTAFLSTPMVHCTASLGQNPHLFVRRGERRLHKDPTSLVVRNGGHSAGFDDRGRLKVF